MASVEHPAPLLAQAAKIVGGELELARRLSVRRMALHRWLQGDRSAPEDVVEAAVDIILAEGQGLTKPLSGPLESRGDRR